VAGSYDDVADPYADVASGDVSMLSWQSGRIIGGHMASFWSSGLVPRGPCMGYHVAPYYGMVWLFKILRSLWGSNPGPPPLWKIFDKVRPTGAPTL
jgi:hypothetical protein